MRYGLHRKCHMLCVGDYRNLLRATSDYGLKTTTEYNLERLSTDRDEIAGFGESIVIGVATDARVEAMGEVKGAEGRA